MLENREETRSEGETGDFDTSRRDDGLDVWQAIKRHKLLFALPMILLAAAGVAYAIHKKPSYTAQSRVGIVRVDVSAPGALAGFATAGEALAETFSRTIKSDGVVQPLAQQLHLPAQTIRDRLNAAA